MSGAVGSLAHATTSASRPSTTRLPLGSHRQMSPLRYQPSADYHGPDAFEVTDNNATFKAHIREGQKFSDGTPVDSAAVKASPAPSTFSTSTRNGGTSARLPSL